MSKIIGINCGPHDSSVCLLEDGKIICAIEEEKLTGVKACYVNFEYPIKSLDYIEKEFGVNIENCDHLAFSRAYVRQFVKDRAHLGGKITSFSHHDCHALGSYFTSGFEGKVISLSHDGKGYRSRGKLFICEDGQFEEIHSQHIPTTASLAGLWAVSTLHLGWRMLKDEGKVVGLAAHGKFSEEIYSHFKQFMYYENFEFKPSNWECLFHYTFNTYKKDNAKIKEWREDFAFTLQKFTEEIFGEFLYDIHQKFPEYRKICFSGGLFANVKLNQFINDLDIFDEIFIHPAMGDGGLAMGAALLKAHELGEIQKPLRLKNAFLGPSYNFNNWNTAISESNLDVKKEPFSYERAAKLIDEGYVLGCFFGRTEYGPRALGNRSIVVKPTDPDTHRKLNEKLKRTEIMPFAPSVLKEEADKVFECDKSKYSAEFMTLCYNARDEWKDKIPAVIQILDSSARPQMVDYDLNPNFHSIISAYYKISGIPLVLNTSFNAHGEPINNYPSQVMKHLGDGSVDFIANEHYILSINRD